MLLLTGGAGSSRVSFVASVRAVDIVLCLMAGVAAGALAWGLFPSLSFTIDNIDVWFDSDSHHIAEAMMSRWSDYHHGNNLHPLFGLISYSLAFISTRLLDFSLFQVMHALTTAAAAAWASMMYVTLRAMKRPPAASVLFTGIGIASTSGLFFLPIAERFVLGSVSMLACLAAFMAHERRHVSGKWLTVAAAGTMGVTITNFMLGAMALVLAFGVRRGLQAAFGAACAIALVGTLQGALFPQSAAMYSLRNGTRYTWADNGGTVLEKTTAFWLHSVVAPEPRNEARKIRLRLSVQRVGIGMHGLIGRLALSLWVVLLAAGAWMAWQRRPAEKVDILLGLVILGQFSLHLVFGKEAILYSPHFTPLIILVASAVVRQTGDPAPGRRAAFYGLSVLLFGFLLWNNWQVFAMARQMAVS
jgi:hypothetical protein